jgi:hypothetical protein
MSLRYKENIKFRLSTCEGAVASAIPVLDFWCSEKKMVAERVKSELGQWPRVV